MLGKSKNKLDSKVRFQQSGFRKQLSDARQYKRNIKHKPEHSFGIFLARIGLNSWLARIAVMALAAVAIYLFLIPNFLTVKHVEFQGLSDPQQSEAHHIFSAYLSSHPFRKNILWFSKSHVSEALTAQDSAILAVTNVKRKLPNTVIFTVRERTDRYMAQLVDGTFIVSNDGLIQSHIDTTTSSTPSTTPLAMTSVPTTTTAGLTIIKISEPIDHTDHHLLPEDLLRVIEALDHDLPQKASVGIASFEITNPRSPDITVHTSSGYAIYFDRNADLAATINQLVLMLKDLSDPQKASLFYIDLRFKDRGFVCIKNTPCTQPVVQPTAALFEGSTTPESILR